ncbi:MAG: hypothetical protein K2M91_12115, partial [Lachnospiraceae bacterium]|nr:hypothetical protein [Lachnospiraceae bacterium]
MLFFNQSGKKKKKEQPSYTGEFQEMERPFSEKNELEKTMFLTPEEQYISRGKDGDRTSQEKGAMSDYSNGST